MDTVDGQEQAENAMLHISEQARDFINNTKARPLNGPLTKQMAAQMRNKAASNDANLSPLASRLQCTISNIRIDGMKVVRV